MRRLLIIPALVGVLSLGLVAKPAHAIPLPPGTENSLSVEHLNCHISFGGVTFTGEGPAEVGFVKIFTGGIHFSGSGEATYLFGPCLATLTPNTNLAFLGVNSGAMPNEALVTATNGAKVSGKGTFVHSSVTNVNLVESWQAFATRFSGVNGNFSDFFTWQQNFNEALDCPAFTIGCDFFGDYDIYQDGVVTKFSNQGFGSFIHTGTGTVCAFFVPQFPQCYEEPSNDYTRNVVFQMTA